MSSEPRVAPTDILIVSAANTSGWRTAAAELEGAIDRAGVKVGVATAARAGRTRTLMLTDFVEARASREAAMRGIALHRPAAVIYCSITAALLWPRPGAIYLDAIAAENRPGRHGIWQRPTERRRLTQTPLVLAWSQGALVPLQGQSPPHEVVPVPIDIHPNLAQTRDVAAVTYAGDPVKRRLSLVLESWAQARRQHETLIITGVDGVPTGEGVRSTGLTTPQEFRGLLARAKVFVAAPRREEYGVAALEALASGCLLVTTPSPGGYPALELARRLDPRLVGDDLARAIRIALDDPLPGYADRAAKLLEPFSRPAVDRVVAERVLPRLLSR